MHLKYSYELLYVISILFLTTVVGWLSNWHWCSLIIGWLIYLGWHIYQLLRLYFLISRKQILQPPFPPGIWREIYRIIGRYQQRSRKRKRNLTRFTDRFRNIATALPDALIVLDKNLAVNWCNTATETMLGFAWPAAKGIPVLTLLGNPKLADYIEHGTYDRPVEMVPPHNSAIVLSLRITPFGGRKRQRLLVARDITQIYHLNQIRRDFVANVSHELRTPLTVINGHIENILASSTIPDRLQHQLSRMQFQATRMTRLIQDLLILSRLDTGETITAQSQINIASLLEGIISEARMLSSTHKYTVVLNYDLWLIANEEEIRSAFSNLVFNAVKHTPPVTTIRILWRLNPGGPQLLVEDTGEGIAAEHIPRLTERFYRVDKGRSHSTGGTGLGLAIVKHVLNRHEADLYISSVIGQGSTFTCQFPKHRGCLHA